MSFEKRLENTEVPLEGRAHPEVIYTYNSQTQKNEISPIWMIGHTLSSHLFSLNSALSVTQMTILALLYLNILAENEQDMLKELEDGDASIRGAYSPLTLFCPQNRKD